MTRAWIISGIFEIPERTSANSVFRMRADPMPLSLIVGLTTVASSGLLTCRAGAHLLLPFGALPLNLGFYGGL
jgi:hypothetical protein